MTCPIHNEYRQGCTCQFHLTGSHCAWYGQIYVEPMTESQIKEKEYYWKNKERMKEYHSAYAKNNPDKIKQIKSRADKKRRMMNKLNMER